MIDTILRVMFEHPLLMLIALVDIALIVVILSYVASKLYGKKRPDRAIRLLITRLRAKRKKTSKETIEGLYDYVLHKYLAKGVIDSDTGRGFRARQKILGSLEGSEKETVKAVFEHYECKLYGGGLLNEQKSVSYLASQLGLD